MKAEYGEDLAEGEESGESSVGGSWLVTRCTASKFYNGPISLFLSFGLRTCTAFCILPSNPRIAPIRLTYF